MTSPRGVVHKLLGGQRLEGPLRDHPGVLLAALVFAIAGPMDGTPETARAGTLVVAGLAVPLFLGASILGRGDRARGLVAHVLVIGFLGGVAGALGVSDGTLDWGPVPLCVATALLALALAPAGRRGAPVAACLVLARRLLPGVAIAAGVGLFALAGVLAVLASVDALFDAATVEAIGEPAGYVCLGPLATWALLLRLGSDPVAPRPHDPIEDGFVPRAAAWLAVPLLLAYGALLYVYAGRISVLRELPRGLVAVPVLAFATVGVLVTLADRTDAPLLLRRAARWFWPALAPLLPLLWISVMRRIDDHGLTHERVFLVVIAAALTAATAVAIVVRNPGRRHLLQVAIALPLVAVPISGPLGVTALAHRSVEERLTTRLVEVGVLDERRAPTYRTLDVRPEVVQEIDDRLRWLLRHGDRARTARFFRERLRMEPPSREWDLDLRRLGLRPGLVPSRPLHLAGPGSERPIAIAGWELLVPVALAADPRTVETPRGRVTLRLGTGEGLLAVELPDGARVTLPLPAPLHARLLDGPPVDELRVTGQGGGWRAELHVHGLVGDRETDGSLRVASLQGNLLLARP